MLDDVPGNFLAFWVATERQDEEDAIIGMAGIEAVLEGAPDIMGVAVSDLARSPLRSARLAALRVAPERQRLGIGRALTQAGIDWARAQGYKATHPRHHDPAGGSHSSLRIHGLPSAG